MARMPVHPMACALIASATLGAFLSNADDLHALKQAARRYVVAINAVLDLPMDADCSQTVSKAGDYAAAKIDYYKAAREAMPSLLQMAKAQKTDTPYGGDLIELLRGSGQEDDQEVTIVLLSKLRGCQDFKEPGQERKAIQDAEQIAQQFLTEFAQLEGVHFAHRLYSPLSVEPTRGSR